MKPSITTEVQMNNIIRSFSLVVLSVGMPKTLLLGVVLLGATLGFAQSPEIYKQECLATTYNVYEDTAYQSGDSDKRCDSGTRYTLELTDPNGVVATDGVKLTRMGSKNEANNWAKLEVTWNANVEGMVTIKIFYERRKKQCGVCGCEWRDKEQLSTYNIYKTSSPTGNLTGESTVVGTSISVPLEVRYQATEPFPIPVNKIKFWVNEQYIGIVEKSIFQPLPPLQYTATGHGNFVFRTELYNKCGWVEGPTKTIEVQPSCYNDNEGDIHFSINGEGMETYADGVMLLVDTPYEIRLEGGTDVYNNYTMFQDGGQEVSFVDGVFTPHKNIGSYTISANYIEDGADRSGCPEIEPLYVFLGGRNTVIEHENSCLLTLPEDFPLLGFDHVQLGDPVLSHFRATAKSNKGFVITPGMTLSMGAELVLDYTASTIDDSEPNPEMNFIQSTAFDDYGRIALQSRQYFDDFGQALQAQVKNLENDVIITSEVVNDFYGRPVLSTLPAPSKAGTFDINEDVCGDQIQTGDYVKFEYHPNFINGESNDKYDHTKFDIDVANDVNREEVPLEVKNNVVGSLGWYYSANNGAATGVDNSKLNEPLVAHTAYPYTRTLFHHDGTESVKSVAGPGEAFRAGSGNIAVSDNVALTVEDIDYLDEYLTIRQNELGFSYPSDLVKSEHFFKSESTDAMKNYSCSYIDKAGNAIVSLYFGEQSTPITRSYTFYDAMGRLLVSLSPNGYEQYKSGVPFTDIDKTEYFYDFQGRLLSTIESDAGRSEFMYRRDGSIRFSQNAEQLANYRLSYTNYDQLGRPIESGELVFGATFNFRTLMQPQLEELDSDWITGLAGNPTKQDWVQTSYDRPDANFSSETGITDRTQRFVRGGVSFTQNANTKTWYSYDERGRAEWVVQEFTDWIENGQTEPVIKLIEYTYGPTGAVQLIAYQRGQEDQFYHYYEYDKDARLSKAYTATSQPVYNVYGEVENREVLKQQALYDYYLHGPLKRVELADQLQGIDFVYTITGALKSINDANAVKDPGEDGDKNNFQPDVFGMTLDYYNGDHQRGTLINVGEEQFTGNIKAQSWFSPVDDGVQRGYVYDYDNRYQLDGAIFGTFGGTGFVPSSTNAYNLSMGGYDLNGNIKGLVRKKDTGIDLHNLAYTYKDNKNQLESVTRGPSPFRSYKYNNIGQMIEQVDELNEETQWVEYDVTGKVKTVNKQNGTNTPFKLAEYTYDDRGFRVGKTVYKEDGTSTQTWYVRDASGSLIRSYNTDATLDEYPIYGASRLGMYRPKALLSDYLYELTDHLGNVRAVIGKSIEVEYLATMETERKEVEQYDAVNNIGGYFDNLKSYPTADYINHTYSVVEEDHIEIPIANPNEVLRINNAQDTPINPIRATKVLPVVAGDKINLEVYVKYADFDQTKNFPFDDIFANIVAAFGDYSSAPGEGIANIFNGIQTQPFWSSDAWNADVKEEYPMAFLNYIVFDKNFNVKQNKRVQVTDAAKIPAEGEGNIFRHPHERLALDVTIEQGGFIYVYLSSEDQQDMDVYFDDLKITHTFSNIVAGSDFYPFGLTMETRDINQEEYKYGYQGGFAEEDEETGYNAFQARMYDPVIGRWSTKDPYFQFHSPYLAMGNNPILYQDSDGRWVQIAVGAVIGGAAAAIKLALEPGDIDWTSGRTWGKIGTGALTGATIAAVPVSVLGVAGAGTAAVVGDVADQAIDVHYGYKQAINLKQAATSGVVTAATAGIGGVVSQNLVKHGREVLHATGKVPWYRFYPNLNAAAVNSTFDVSRFLIENRDPLLFDSFLNFHFSTPNAETLPDNLFINSNTSEHSNYGRDRGEIHLVDVVISGKRK